MVSNKNIKKTQEKKSQAQLTKRAKIYKNDKAPMKFKKHKKNQKTREKNQQNLQ